MAFYMGDLLVDRVALGVAEDPTSGKLLYTLTNLQELKIDIAADSKDAKDGTGAVVRTFYTGKTGKLTATNSTLSLPIVNAMGGSDAVLAGEKQSIVPPHIITTAKTTVTLPGISDDGANAHIVVNAIAPNGALGAEYKLTTGYKVAAPTSGGNSTLTITPANGDTKWIIKYDRTVTSDGVKIINRSDEFPNTIKLTLKALICDPCEPGVVRAAYIVAPNFQPSPELSLDLTTDATLDYTGNLLTSYCATEKVLYEIYVCEDDVED